MPSAALNLGLLAAALAAANASPAPGCTGPTLTCKLVPTLSANLDGAVGTVFGQVVLTPTTAVNGESGPSCAAHVTGAVAGLGDATLHGWHIHQYGDVSGGDGKATGGHFNPHGKGHGLEGEKHVGDLGNLKPDKSGIATLDEVVNVLTGEVMGRGLIVHAKEDDGGQPTGNAGARLAQCVLGIKG